MTTQQQLTRHSVEIDADVESVYRLVENVAAWPAIFGPTVYVLPLERDGNRERFRIWATVNGKVARWTSARSLDPENRCISFEQEHPDAPLAAMGGRWEFRATRRGGTEVVLHHHFRMVDESPEAADWVRRALDHNSAAELTALANVAGTGHPVGDVLFTFRQTLTGNGSVADAYDFVYHAEHWPARLPHVADVRLIEEETGVQELEMVTKVPGGGTHTTESVRVCFPGEVIVYKQSVVPDPLMGHSGLWRFGRQGDDLVIASEHTVLLAPDRVKEVLGTSATVADARAFVREALENNSRVTMTHAKEFAERARTESGAEMTA
jgi:aromatase